MAPQILTTKRLKPRPTLVPFKDDTSLIALRYEKTVQAEPPIPILTRIPPRSPSVLTRRTSTSASSSFASPPTSPVVVVVAPPAIEQHPAFRSRAPAADEAVDKHDWKRDSGLAPTASSSDTIVEEGYEKEDYAGDKLGSLVIARELVQQQSPLVTPSFCETGSVYSPDGLDLSAWSSGRCTSPTGPLPVHMDDYHIAQLQIADGEVFMENRTDSCRPFEAADSPAGSRDQSLSDMLPTAMPIMAPARVSSTTSDESLNLSPVTTPDELDLLSKDAASFSPISLSIPTVSLLDDDFLTTLSFSNRGSIMFGGRRAFPLQTTTGSTSGEAQTDQHQTTSPATTFGVAPTPTLHVQYEDPPESFAASPALPASSQVCSNEPTTTESITVGPNPSGANASDTIAAAQASVTDETAESSAMTTPSIRVLSADVEMESRKVRSLYESGEGINWEDGRPSDVGEHLDPTPENPSDDVENDPVADLQPPVWGTPRSGSSYSQRPETRSEYEVAGGLEDWEDLSGYDVDRYGFINPRKLEAKVGTSSEPKPAPAPLRKKNLLVKRDPFGLGLPVRGPGRKVSARSLNTQTSKASAASRRSTRSAIRRTGNLLPHNRDRRWIDDAGDMLSLSLGEEEKIEKISEAIKRKEWERSEKWRKMARVVKKGNNGEGMEFEFDHKNQKLIERTWKGIPDRWRASAWYSFMASSARAHKDSPSDDSIITDFHRLQARGSPDDVQIDLDVPRTISRHVMFRKRYRGGQRLLFRVLHALSLYFPHTGYVQGMASLAATLLCYFDEEKCFVMLVRMWQLRGLEKLYSPGFDGLMAALNDLQTKWLDGKDVAKKLTDLCIDPTAYGTRWYLTLFNLSIPFAAQLRVWDVFLLLGGHVADSPAPKSGDSQVTMHGIDILHATSAALIHALREVLLDSDFENAMKALTSWIPVKDEDLLMKVTRAEWKSRQKKRP
ncbi:TBC domain-containing protein [Colletotrichum sidae]|uniref:TBC domain-containing protein n=1 Tax=Colletotrichum sidae TaxID=1347389 RepID=A0A4R8T4E1_9PEZI|nr:TBC domain-containing protein [Colletotrichum sidae]